VRIAAGLVALVVAAPTVMAQEPGPENRFALLQDGPGKLWLTDTVEGKVARCLEGAARAPRVIDMVDGSATARPRGGPGTEPLCTDWVTAGEPEARIKPKVIGGAGG
jgi:hypothetical protein